MGEGCWLEGISQKQFEVGKLVVLKGEVWEIKEKRSYIERVTGM